ncbi:MAG TPA: mobile mystery protein B [Pirellulales bacterium]
MNDWGKPIDGETPLPDRSHLLQPSILTRHDLNVAEANNIESATYKYLAARPSKRLAPFTYEWVLRLHREMLGKVWDYAGQVRTISLNFGVQPGLVPAQLMELLEDLQHWSTYKLPLVEQATRLHYRTVHIHPFLNGNGRWSRMLANIWLARHGHATVDWPAHLNTGRENPSRDEYLAAVRAADDGDFEPLLEMHLRYSRR